MYKMFILNSQNTESYPCEREIITAADTPKANRQLS